MAHSCNSKCKQWNRGERDRCKEIRDCACNVCSPLKAVNKQLHDACVGSCNSSVKPTNTEAYICDNVGSDAVFNNFGILCGDIRDTAQYQAFEFEESTETDVTPFLAMGLVIVVFLIIYLMLD